MANERKPSHSVATELNCVTSVRLICCRPSSNFRVPSSSINVSEIENAFHSVGFTEVVTTV